MSDPKKLLRAHGLQPKKSWGQNFLVNPHTVQRIVDTLKPDEDSVIVEFGAGTGALTFLLAERAKKIYAVERDRELAELLRQELTNEKVVLLEADAARFSLEDLDEAGELLVIGNLPYQITAPILFQLHEQRHTFKRAVVMVQKEVADRLSARPGMGKEYSILSILFGAYFNVKQAIQVSRTHFFPRPKVSSAVVLLETRPEPLVPIADDKWFMRTVKVAFAQRRKTLQNNLRAGFHELEKEAITEVLQELEIDPQVRGETLTIEQFVALAKILQERYEMQDYKG